MKWTWRACGGVFLVFLLLAVPVSAQEEEMDYSYGTVVRVNGIYLVVSEYDYQDDKDVEMTYRIASDVMLDNIESVEEIQPGDEVEFNYLEKGDEFIIKELYVEKME